ncbi:MAG TPA: carotenoid oxygenase family protein [Acidimicrobiales bacterium]|jgi:carotenoid cleavage dioxygenase
MGSGSGLEFGLGLGGGDAAPLRVEGVLPPDLEGTFVRIGPGGLHAVELREGRAVSYRACQSAADANVFWHAGSLLALPEAGIPLQYSRELDEEAFGGGLTLDIASHVKFDAARGRRVLFGVEEGAESTTLRLGEWAGDGSLVAAQSVALERATWQHDLGVTASSIVFIESPTEPLGGGDEAAAAAVPYGWVPGAEGWLGVVRREDVRGVVAEPQWVKVDPCLVTHVLGAFDDGDDGVVLFVVVYPAPEVGQPVAGVAPGVSVVGPDGIGRSLIGGGLGVLERWSVRGGRLERAVVDERFVEYPRVDAMLEGAAFRYGYGVELALVAERVEQVGLLKFDVGRDEVAAWSPGAGLVAGEPVFVRAVDGRGDDEGWLLTVVDDAGRGGSDLWVLDASSIGGRRRGLGHPQAVVHLPDGARLPFRSHGEWVSAEKYR